MSPSNSQRPSHAVSNALNPASAGHTRGTHGVQLFPLWSSRIDPMVGSDVIAYIWTYRTTRDHT
jgi:hypothetical protein